ncbi:hypothetical protein C8R44DRAFT_740056 [Mycena epipterygia]|nr:hypothetical protein C8R44DRAFT_740056 [Mycena epipterygia]
MFEIPCLDLGTSKLPRFHLRRLGISSCGDQPSTVRFFDVGKSLEESICTEVSNGESPPGIATDGATPGTYVGLPGLVLSTWQLKWKSPEQSGIDGPSLYSTHVGAVWTFDIYKIDFLVFKLLDLPLTIMSELKTVIKLHSICVTSLTNPHDDLPGDMKMFSQLIVEENIFLHILPVVSEHNQMSWKLNFECNIPPHALTFSVAVLRQSETEGIRLVGYVEIRRGEVLGCVESNRRKGNVSYSEHDH